MNNNKDIKKIIEDLLNGINIKYEIIEETEDPDTQKKLFRIKTSESGLLIGDRGETFQAFSHLIRRIANKGLEENHSSDQPVNFADFAIDVNDYRSSMIDKLKLTAEMLANRAVDMKTNVEMEPMSSYERLIVHGALTGRPNIKTESVGEGRNRRLVIKYVKDTTI